MTPPFRFGVALLGAGSSSRMGEPKLLLPWNSSSIIGHLISLWRTAEAQHLAVVCAPPPHPLHDELDRLGFPENDRILNPNPQHGMFSSIQCAARWPHWRYDLTHFALVLGDQPQISLRTIKAVLSHAAAHPQNISQPSFQGRPKHPVVFPGALFAEVSRTNKATLRDFLEERPAARSFLDIPDAALNLDLDLPADYRAARERFSNA